MTSSPKTLGVVLYEDFELLDVFGPLEMLGYVPDLQIILLAPQAGPVRSTQGPAVLAEASLEQAPPLDMLLVPGGIGTRGLADDRKLLDELARRCSDATLVLSVCTGSALLAQAGVLDGRRATSNKMAFAWVKTQGPKVEWAPRARWVWDGKFVTASGVAAGTDMSLAVVEHLQGTEFAETLARLTEYEWRRDPDRDPFAVA